MLKKLPQIFEGDFHEAIGAAMKAGRHVEYLTRVLENFEWYRKTFAGVFVADGMPAAIYAFRVTYRNKPNVWRTIEIEGKQTFEHLAKKIVNAMGWRYDHMHGFTIPGFVKPAKDDIPFDPTTTLTFFERHWEDDPFPVFKSNQIQIHQLDHQKYPKLDFIFDYGDGHEFTIEYQGRRDKNERDANEKFPLLVDQRGVAPAQY